MSAQPVRQRRRSAADPTLGELAELVLRARWKGTRCELQATSSLGECLAILGATRRASSLRQADVQALLAGLARPGRARGTVRRKLGAFSAMVREARLAGFSVPPLEIRFPSHAEGRVRILSEAEEPRLFEALAASGPRSGEISDLARCLLALGCRYSELGRSQKGAGALGRDVQERDGRLWVVFTETKNGGRRTLPVPRAVESILRSAVRGPDVPLFDADYQTVRQHWKRAVELAGLEGGLLIHTLRHTCITRLLRAGVPVVKVKEWAGHRSIQTTLGYTHLTGMDLVDAADALG